VCLNAMNASPRKLSRVEFGGTQPSHTHVDMGARGGGTQKKSYYFAANPQGLRSSINQQPSRIFRHLQTPPREWGGGLHATFSMQYTYQFYPILEVVAHCPPAPPQTIPHPTPQHNKRRQVGSTPRPVGSTPSSPDAPAPTSWTPRGLAKPSPTIKPCGFISSSRFRRS